MEHYHNESLFDIDFSDEDFYQLLNSSEQPEDVNALFPERQHQQQHHQQEEEPPAARPHTPMQIVDDIGLPIPVPPPCRVQDWARDLLTYLNDAQAPDPARNLVVVYTCEHAMLPDGNLNPKSPAASFIASMMGKYHHMRVPPVKASAQAVDYLVAMKHNLRVNAPSRRYPLCFASILPGTPSVGNLVSAVTTMQDPKNEWTGDTLSDARFVLFVHDAQMFPVTFKFPSGKWSAMFVDNSNGNLYTYNGEHVVWDYHHHRWGKVPSARATAL